MSGSARDILACGQYKLHKVLYTLHLQPCILRKATLCVDVNKERNFTEILFFPCHPEVTEDKACVLCMPRGDLLLLLCLCWLPYSTTEGAAVCRVLRGLPIGTLHHLFHYDLITYIANHVSGGQQPSSPVYREDRLWHPEFNLRKNI